MSSGTLSGSLTKCTCIYNERPVIHENLYTFFATFYIAAGPLIWQANSLNKGHFVQHGAKPLSATTESIAGPYVHVNVANITHIFLHVFHLSIDLGTQTSSGHFASLDSIRMAARVSHAMGHFRKRRTRDTSYLCIIG